MFVCAQEWISRLYIPCSLVWGTGGSWNWRSPRQLVRMKPKSDLAKSTKSLRPKDYSLLCIIFWYSSILHISKCNPCKWSFKYTDWLLNLWVAPFLLTIFFIQYFCLTVFVRYVINLECKLNCFRIIFFILESVFFFYNLYWHIECNNITLCIFWISVQVCFLIKQLPCCGGCFFVPFFN